MMRTTTITRSELKGEARSGPARSGPAGPVMRTALSPNPQISGAAAPLLAPAPAPVAVSAGGGSGAPAPAPAPAPEVMAGCGGRGAPTPAPVAKAGGGGGDTSAPAPAPATGAGGGGGGDTPARATGAGGGGGGVTPAPARARATAAGGGGSNESSAAVVTCTVTRVVTWTPSAATKAADMADRGRKTACRGRHAVAAAVPGIGFRAGKVAAPLAPAAAGGFRRTDAGDGRAEDPGKRAGTAGPVRQKPMGGRRRTCRPASSPAREPLAATSPARRRGDPAV